MRSDRDVAAGWIQKAESDLANVAICLERNVARDTACFHAQQAAEKYLKAYLTYHDVDFPFVHDLERLVTLCAQLDPAYADIRATAASLTPYAVVLRYDMEFWPAIEEVRAAQEGALQIKRYVIDRLPLGPAS